MFRSLIIPTILVLLIASPFLFSKSNTGPTGQQGSNSQIQGTQIGYDAYGNPMLLPSSQSRVQGYRQSTNPYKQANASVNFQTAPMGNPSLTNHSLNNQANPAMPMMTPNHGNPNPGIQAGSPVQTGGIPAIQVGAPVVIGSGQVEQGIDFAGMTPDYGAAQTFILPGNAHGPDLNAQPLQFLPVTNFEEILHFNVTQSWIKSRWKRVSTTPVVDGLHGLRVALVTGTNSWDLHGSLTYFLDPSQRVQRITFRGWAGDSTKLTNLLTQKDGFRPQQTHWAGFYVAQKNRSTTGGLLMKHPNVIHTDNPVQQVAIVMEINNPNSNYVLSKDFHSLIEGSLSGR